MRAKLYTRTRPWAMKSPGSRRELAPRAYRKPMGKPLEACREPLGKLLGGLWTAPREALIKGLGGAVGSSCRKLL